MEKTQLIPVLYLIWSTNGHACWVLKEWEVYGKQCWLKTTETHPSKNESI